MKNYFLSIAALFAFENAMATECMSQLSAKVSDDVTAFYSCGPSACAATHTDADTGDHQFSFLDANRNYSLTNLKISNNKASGVHRDRSGQFEQFRLKAEFVAADFAKVKTVHLVESRGPKNPRPPRVVGQYKYNCQLAQ